MNRTIRNRAQAQQRIYIDASALPLAKLIQWAYTQGFKPKQDGTGRQYFVQVAKRGTGSAQEIAEVYGND